jgi:hypothetical protein
MKLYMFRTVPLPIIRSSFTVHSAIVYVIQVCRQLSSRTRMEISSILVLLVSCAYSACMTYTIAECTVNKLLKMYRGTVRNM